jgi:hypothetical protein
LLHYANFSFSQVNDRNVRIGHLHFQLGLLTSDTSLMKRQHLNKNSHDPTQGPVENMNKPMKVATFAYDL